MNLIGWDIQRWLPPFGHDGLVLTCSGALPFYRTHLMTPVVVYISTATGAYQAEGEIGRIEKYQNKTVIHIIGRVSGLNDVSRVVAATATARSAA